MPADGKQINMHFPRKNPHFPIRLNSVYMKQGSGIYFLNDPARLFNGFHRTNFIIHLRDTKMVSGRIAALRSSREMIPSRFTGRTVTS